MTRVLAGNANDQTAPFAPDETIIAANRVPILFSLSEHVQTRLLRKKSKTAARLYLH